MGAGVLSASLVWSAIAVFAVFGLGVALLARRRMGAGAADYYLGGGLSGLVAGLSYAATTYSAFMLVVLTGLAYRGGIGALGFELIYFAGLSLLVIFGPRFWLVAQAHGFVSPAEMLGARYGSPAVARAAAAVGMLFLLPYCTTQMAGIGILISGVTGGGISLTAAVVAGAALALVWTVIAGLRSVAWTDAVLAVVMMGSALVAVWLAVDALGGWGGFWAGLMAETPAHLTVPGPGLWSLPTFLALSFPWFFFALSNPQVSQRLFMLKDLGALRRMILWVLAFGFVFTLIAVVWGLAALRLAPGLEQPAGATAAVLTSGVLPVPVAILLIVGILSAAISTLDSIALTVGALVARDLLPQRSDAAQIMVGRIAVTVVIVFAAVFGVSKAGIVEQLAALSAAGLLPVVAPIVGAFFWKRGTAAGALAAIVLGAAAAAVMGFGLGISPLKPVLPFTVAAVSVLAFIAVSLMTRPRSGALDFDPVIRAGLARHNLW